MAVTTQNSSQMNKVDGVTAGRLDITEARGDLRTLTFGFTQSGAGDANSVARLFKLPPGKVRLVDLRFTHDALGGATDVGTEAYVAKLDGTDVAADATAIASASATTNAGSKDIFVNQMLESRHGVVVYATFAAAIADGKKVAGVATYVGG